MVPGGEIIARPPYKVTIYPYSTWETVQLYGQEFVDMMNQKRIGCDKYPLVKNFRSWAISDDVLAPDGDPEALSYPRSVSVYQ